MYTIIQFTYNNEQCVGRVEAIDGDTYYVMTTGGEVVELTADEMSNIQTLDADMIRFKLRQFFSVLVFRRVYSTQVDRMSKTYIGERWENGEDVYRPADRQDIEHLKRLQRENRGEKNNQKNADLVYRKKHVLTCGMYRTVTNKNAMRGNDPVPGQPIHLTESTYRQFDIWNLEFLLSTVGEAYDAPLRGDLVCGIVGWDQHGKPHYTQWFKASEQLLKLWTILMEPLNKSIESSPAKRAKRLQTANFTTWCIENPNADQTKRFYRSRYERDASMPDTYVWLGMMAGCQDIRHVKRPVEAFDYLCTI